MLNVGSGRHRTRPRCVEFGESESREDHIFLSAIRSIVTPNVTESIANVNQRLTLEGLLPSNCSHPYPTDRQSYPAFPRNDSASSLVCFLPKFLLSAIETDKDYSNVGSASCTNRSLVDNSRRNMTLGSNKFGLANCKPLTADTIDLAHKFELAHKFDLVRMFELVHSTGLALRIEWAERMREYYFESQIALLHWEPSSKPKP